MACAAFAIVTPNADCTAGTSESHTRIEAMLAKQQMLSSHNILLDTTFPLAGWDSRWIIYMQIHSYLINKLSSYMPARNGGLHLKARRTL
jgi:hypothetical protein